MKRTQGGFTVVELLTAMFVFSVVSAGFYSIMLSSIRGADTTEAVVRVSEEARLGFNRMIRDTRESLRIVEATTPTTVDPRPPASFTIHIDFNADGDIRASDGEIETFAFANRQITLNGNVLIDNVEPIPGVPVFDFSSNQLQYDWAPVDGVARWNEIDNPPSGTTQPGNRNGAIDRPELPYLTNVSFSLRIRTDNKVTAFYTQAQLRNARVQR